MRSVVHFAAHTKECQEFLMDLQKYVRISHVTDLLYLVRLPPQ